MILWKRGTKGIGLSIKAMHTTYLMTRSNIETKARINRCGGIYDESVDRGPLCAIMVEGARH
jgi:hypothetical protein